MAKRWRVAGNICAIWKGETDTAPFTNPKANLSRVLFHSGFNYTKIIDQKPFNVYLPPRDKFQSASQTIPLYAHGRGGFPVIGGIITVGGQPIDFAGSIPVQLNNAGLNPTFWPQGFARWLSLGADATYVYVHEYCVNYWSNSSSYGSYPAITVPVTVLMTNELL
ncbi:hypothetical protein [Hyphomicrobium sp. DY-1]|uniref:hypothetical protein n=1 Tax=Hyphomicrobium sp. DY-1 TaxID=3075650 RepID=UPI0039C440B3